MYSLERVEMSFDDDFAAFEAALAGTGPVKPAVAATFSAPAVPVSFYYSANDSEHTPPSLLYEPIISYN